MRRVHQLLFVKWRHNWGLLFRFGVVGASGVVINLVVLSIALALGPEARGVWVDLPLTTFNVRWYHVFVTIAFFVANLWNFQLNRGWTFATSGHASWAREYAPFLLVGLISLALNLGIVTVLLHQHSPLQLPTDVFGDFASRVRWANLMAIAVITPLSFATNKLWTFRAVRHHAGGRGS